MQPNAENVVFGTGPLGLAVAGRLMSSGQPVRLVNRSGKADAPQGVEVVAADVTDPAAARRVCEGAAIVFHCASGPYGRWTQTLPPIMNGIIDGATASGARLVYGDNLYAYGPVDGPIRENLPYRPIGPTTRARAQVATTLMNAHAAGTVRATIGRASDFYGPRARQSKVGNGVFARALAGKPAQTVGDPDTLHTYTFIDDFAAGLLTLAQRDEALGEVWHIPSAETVTTRRFIEMVFEQLQRPARLQTVPRLMISTLGLFIPAMRAVKETLYQSERPWVVDHSKFARAFGSRPTQHEQAIQETLAWWQGKPTVAVAQS
ncbi:MAG TPA: NAD-dependent epimerase/dehydratase family protein [Candidatus Dormibacteraeota bacterium]|nr:NAD-dependent epimerase/dehydratase family protein [Candidatus Dormibacteraeota bacterium]